MAQLNDLIVTGKSRFLNDISGTVEKAKTVNDDFINTLGIFTDANAGPIQVVTDSATVVPLLFTGSTAYSTLGDGFNGRAFYLNGVFFGAVIDDIYFKVYVDSSGSISSTIRFFDCTNFENIMPPNGWSFVDGSNSSSYNSTEGYFNTSSSFSTATPIPSFDGITVNWSISPYFGINVSASSSSSSSGYANKYFYFKNPKKIYAFSRYSLLDKNLISYGTYDMTAGTDNLITGTIYCMYEA